MDAVKYIKELKRMCNYYGNCKTCPIGKEKGILACWDYRDSYPETFVSLVSEWSVKNKPITNQEKFHEVFGIDFYDAMTTLHWAYHEYKEIK